MNNKTQLKRASNLGVIFYSCGDLASQFVWTFIGSYLTVFYTDYEIGRASCRERV